MFEEFSDKNLRKVSKLGIECHTSSRYLGNRENALSIRKQKLESLNIRLSSIFRNTCYIQYYDSDGGETEAMFIYWK